jgi:hypothetical protein
MTSVELVQQGTNRKTTLFLHVLDGQIVITPPTGLLDITPKNARKLARMLLQAAEKVTDE